MDMLAAIAQGIPLTIGVTVASFALAAVAGVPLVLGLRSPRALVRVPIRAVVDLVRSIPILVWIFLLYFGLSVGGFRLDNLQAAILALGGVSAAYLAEVYRGAIESVDPGQWEAGRALALSPTETFTKVIAPQAVRVALPSATTFALTLLKDSSIPSVIGVAEISHFTLAESRATGQGLTAFTTAVVLYIVLSVPIALLSRYLDHRMRRKVAR
ncbi:amino acid ABC transporter permease [Georgenia yuyongxinii]|uniref:Amino acid ABC transporter permease n=1 Tax=Georgenia yuyongxinii TaxID=2589797 RepID=A0A5B8C084_9MICO|nr:amino acid ABC transporter permease [Georgenia yuyongxinii]QDC23410.1 amino acid ABC transporter permease [Georgenia yuyongxinii]